MVNGTETEVAPYSTCELDSPDCTKGKPFELDLNGAEEFTLKIPEDVHDHRWALLKVYDDPGANNDTYFDSYEQPEVTISAKADRTSEDGKQPKVAVVEVQSLLIGEDENKDQTPITTVWSFKINP